MRFVTFNIHHGTVGRRGPVDPAQLAEVCAAFGADVLALQEVDVGTRRVDGVDLAAIVAEACGAAHVFGESQAVHGGAYGNALVVRGEIGRWAVHRLPKVPFFRFGQEQRTVLDAEVIVDGRALSVASTHLAVRRRINGPQLRALLRILRGRPGPLVAMGDLNRRTPAVAPLVAAAGLHLVPHGPTYPAAEPRTDIDHVITSSDVQVQTIEVRATSMSDHAALIVDLELPSGT